MKPLVKFLCGAVFLCSAAASAHSAADPAHDNKNAENKSILFKNVFMKRACSINANLHENNTCEFHPTIKIKIIYG